MQREELDKLDRGKESEDFIWAEAASGTEAYVALYYENLDRKIYNPALRFWVEAIQRWKQLEPNNWRLEELIFILSNLHTSLDMLAGANINQRRSVPSLYQLYKKTLKEDKGWELSEDLLLDLKKMSILHNNLCKHVSKNLDRQEMLKELNLEKISKYVEAARQIWLWVLTKKFNGHIPEIQATLFNN